MRRLRLLSLYAFGFGLLLACLLLSPGRSLASTESICRKWFKQKKYAEAARCFLGLYQQLKRKEKRTEEEQEKMGAALRNAGLILREAADSEQNAANAAFLRERAVRHFTLFLKQKLYTSDTQRRYTLVQRDALKEKIGYARLSLLAPAASQLQITGYRFSAKSEGPWSKDVRPGTYAIIARYEGRTETREIKLLPGQPKVLRLLTSAPTQGRASVPTGRRLPALRREPVLQRDIQRPAPPLQVRSLPVVRRRPTLEREPVARRLPLARQPAARNGSTLAMTKRPVLRPKPPANRILPWVLVGVGVAAIAAGGILSGVAVTTLGQRDARLKESLDKREIERSIDDTKAVMALHTQANTQLLSGVIVGSVGVGVVGVGLILLAIPPAKP